MTIKTTLKIAENLFNAGFTFSKSSSGTIYNVLTGEVQHPPQDVLEALEFICDFNFKIKSGTRSN